MVVSKKAWRLHLTDLPDILHNIADHTQTLFRLLAEESTAPEVVERLKQHMLLEEQENTARLQELHSTQPQLLTQKLLDHSFFIQKMMKEEAMSLELKRELLDHFMEEHVEWAAELAPPAHQGYPSSPKEVTTESKGSQWTVGPLWPQGG